MGVPKKPRLTIHVLQTGKVILPPVDMPEPSYELVKRFEDMRLFAWHGGLWCTSTLRDLTPEGLCEQVLARINQSALGKRRLFFRKERQQLVD